MVVLNCSKAKAYGSDFVKQGSKFSLTYACTAQLALTVVMPNLFYGNEMQNMIFVDQKRSYATLIKPVMRTSCDKSAGAGCVRSG